MIINFFLDIITTLFPDAAAIWAALAAAAAIASAVVVTMDHRFQRRMARLPQPNVSVLCAPLKDAPNWFQATLTIGNTLPHALTCNSITVVKPRSGVLLLPESAIERPDGLGNSIMAPERLGQATAQARTELPLVFDVARAGVPGPIAIRRLSDHESRSFLVFASPRLFTKSSKWAVTWSMRLDLTSHDRVQTKWLITLTSKLTAESPSTIIATSS